MDQRGQDGDKRVVIAQRVGSMMCQRHMPWRGTVRLATIVELVERAAEFGVRTTLDGVDLDGAINAILDLVAKSVEGSIEKLYIFDLLD